MNPKKLKALFRLGLILLILIVAVALLLNNTSSNNTKNDKEERGSSYVYNFDQTVDLDAVDINEDANYELGTDYPDYGALNEYYKNNTEYFYEDNDLYIQDFDGYQVVSSEWKKEGFGELVEEPTFGVLEKFILSSNEASARYNEVSMKDVVNYIKKLKQQGFTEVTLDDRNNRNDYYYFSAKDGDNTVTLNYEGNSLLIVIF